MGCIFKRAANVAVLCALTFTLVSFYTVGKDSLGRYRAVQCSNEPRQSTGETSSKEVGVVNNETSLSASDESDAMLRTMRSAMAYQDYKDRCTCEGRQFCMLGVKFEPLVQSFSIVTLLLVLNYVLFGMVTLWHRQ